MQSSSGPFHRSPEPPRARMERGGRGNGVPGQQLAERPQQRADQGESGRALGGQSPDEQTIGITQEGWCEAALASVLS